MGVSEDEKAEGEVIGSGEYKVAIRHEVLNFIVIQECVEGRDRCFRVDPQNIFPEDLRFFSADRVGKTADLPVHV